MGKAFLLIAVFLATAVPNWAAVVRLVEEAPGLYRIEGEALDRVASLDLVVDYDASTLQLSSASPGALLQGMLFAGNPNQPGRVRIGAVGTETISGSGILVTLGGTVKSSLAVILSLTAKLSDPSGWSLPVRIEYPKPSSIERQNPPDTHPIQEPVSPSSPLSSGQSGSRSISTGKIDLPSPWATDESEPSRPVDEPKPYVELSPEHRPQPRAVQKRSDRPSEPYVEKQQVEFPAIQELFKHYEGPRTLAEMAQLFNRESVELQQQPGILLADGVSSLEVMFPVKGDENPSFALLNARLLKARTTDEGQILIRCIPEKDALTAKILFLGSKEMVEIPLTVTPPVSIAGMEIHKEGPLPKLDLDGDGKSTWEDDYILVANLLAQGEVSEIQWMKLKSSIPKLQTRTHRWESKILVLDDRARERGAMSK